MLQTDAMERIVAALAANEHHPGDDVRAVAEDKSPTLTHGLTAVFAADVVEAGSGVDDPIAAALVSGARAAMRGQRPDAPRLEVMQKTHQLRHLVNLFGAM